MESGRLTYDSVLTHVGDFGRYQKMVILLVYGVCVPNSFSVYQMSFHGMEPSFRCAIPGLANDTYAIQSEAHERLLLSSIPVDESTHQYSRCNVYAPDVGTKDVGGDVDGETANKSSRQTTKCTRWVYNTEEFTASFVADMDLVCDRRAFKVHADTAVLLGLMVFSLIGGTMADLLGRKTCILLFLFVHCVASTAYAFATSMLVVLALTFILGGCLFVIFLCAFILVTEFVSPRWRTVAGMSTMLGWATGLFVLDLVFFLLRDWRVAQLMIALSPACFLPYYWILPESPRWLLVKNRRREAEMIIRKMARANHAELPDLSQLTISLTGHEEGTELDACPGGEAGNGGPTQERRPDKQMKIWHICTSRTLVIRYLILIFGWGTLSMVYLGTSQNVGALVEGSVYVNFALQSVMECLAYVLTLACLEKVGRKPFYISNILTGGLACITMAVLRLAGADVQWVNMLLFCLGKFTITSALCMIYIIGGELLPTVVRNSGMGVCSLLCRVFTVLSPYVANLNLVIPGPIGRALPLLIFGICPFTAGLLAFLFPETRGRKLPDTIQEAKNFGKKETLAGVC